LKRNPSGREVPKKATAERQSKNGNIRESDLVGFLKNVSVRIVTKIASIKIMKA
jgi:hypothetical protein